MKLYQCLAQMSARLNGKPIMGSHDAGLNRIADKWISACLATAPHGSGFDEGVSFCQTDSGDTRLVFHTSFHHMNDVGMYDGWTDHTITVKASLGLAYDLKISGRDRNQIKDYIAEVFSAWLDSEAPAFDPAWRDQEAA